MNKEELIENKMSLREWSITRIEGELYNAKCTDSYGRKAQNWFEHAHDANDWIYYMWEKEDWFANVDNEELLASAIFRAIKAYKLKREIRDASLQSESMINDMLDPIEIANDQAQKVIESSTLEKQSTIKPEIVPQSGLYFSVQIAVSRNDLPCQPQNFMGLTSVYKTEQYGLFKYYFGTVTTFRQAEALKDSATQYYPDAYIVAFDDDHKIDLKDAIKRAP